MYPSQDRGPRFIAVQGVKADYEILHPAKPFPLLHYRPLRPSFPNHPPRPQKSSSLPNLPSQHPTTLSTHAEMDNKPLSEYITMISNDGFEFIIKRDAANVAGTIRKMLDPTSTASYLSPSLSFAQISKRPFIYSLHLCTLPVVPFVWEKSNFEKCVC